MKINSILNYKASFNALKLISLICVIASFIFAITLFIYTQNIINSVNNKIYVMDARGNVTFAESEILTIKTRIYEYENHVKTFYRLWYELDQNTFRKNVDQALFLIGDSGKEMWNEYKEQNLQGILSSKNMNTSIVITNIIIDINSIPITGYIEGVQTINRTGNSATRNMNCRFTLKDVQRSRENPHGALIDNWIVIDSKIIDNEKN